jgi:branched-chain amino acid transport system ATP-binding protein
MAEPMLELVSIEVRYGAVPAVRGVSFRVAEGEIVGLIGPNGAGKSTTLHAITGLVPAHAGHIRVEGESIVGRPPERIAQSGVSLVPEGRRIYADFTVEENLRLGLAARRGQGALGEAYELFPMLREFRRRSAGALSGGQQQQLAIARALVAKPRLLLLDEPSLGLAPRIVAQIFGLLRQLVDSEGLSVLLVEQNARSALSVADVGVVLNLGKVVVTDQARTLMADEGLRHAYLGF